MIPCIEIAVFQVKEGSLEQAIALSKAIFSEMNALETVITDYQILKKIDNPNELCWQLTWANEGVAKETTLKWPIFNSTKPFEDLVIKDLYYGHFQSTEAVS